MDSVGGHDIYYIWELIWQMAIGQFISTHGQIPYLKRHMKPYTLCTPMQDIEGFIKYFECGLTQGPTSLNLVFTYVEFGTTPWVMRLSTCIVYTISPKKKTCDLLVEKLTIPNAWKMKWHFICDYLSSTSNFCFLDVSTY